MPNSISEWFGHRIYPTVCGAAAAQAEQRRYSCPFLTRALNATSPVQCVKAANSRGVCTVSSNSNGTQQDWVVCPYRTIDSEIFAHVSRRLFSAQNTVELIPAPRLAIAAARRSLMERLERHQTALVLFMDKLGGEIDLPGSRRSPKFKLDTTIVELSQDQQGQLQLGRYAVIEVQTMDFHGTYRHATTSLVSSISRDVVALAGADDLVGAADVFADQADADHRHAEQEEQDAEQVNTPSVSREEEAAVGQHEHEQQAARRAQPSRTS
jgi:hypothetical protein